MVVKTTCLGAELLFQDGIMKPELQNLNSQYDSTYTACLSLFR